jgi:chemotaxis protein CheX
MMDQEAIVAAVRASTEEVFSTMLGMEIAACDPYVEKTPPGPSQGIIAVVGLAGAWIGTGSVNCSRDLSLRLASALLMTEYDDVSDEVLDAMSEVTNMIVGNFKNQAEPFLGPLGLSIPTVIYGLNFSARSAGKEQWIVVPFTVSGESLEIKIYLTRNRGLSHVAHLVGPAATKAG